MRGKNIKKYAYFLLVSILIFSCGNEQDVKDYRKNLKIAWLFVDEVSMIDSEFNKSVVLELSNELIETFNPSFCKGDTDGVIFSNINNANDIPFIRKYYGCQSTFRLRSIEPPDYIRQIGYRYLILELNNEAKKFVNISMLYEQFQKIFESEMRIVLFDRDTIFEFKNDDITKGKSRFYYMKEDMPLDSVRAIFVW